MIDLKALVKGEMEKTRLLIRDFPWSDPEAYAMWLAQTYHMVNHSTRLVALAGALTDLGRNDLHARFVDHSREERGHQLICVSDLRELGRKVEDYPCLEPSAALYQVQYYWIEHRSPIAFFGYTLALECMAGAFGKEILAQVLATHGPRASKFVKLHAEDDLEHTEKAFQQLHALSSDERAMVQENLELSAGLYRAMLTEVRSWVSRRENRKAA